MVVLPFVKRTSSEVARDKRILGCRRVVGGCCRMLDPTFSGVVKNRITVTKVTATTALFLAIALFIVSQGGRRVTKVRQVKIRGPLGGC